MPGVYCPRCMTKVLLEQDGVSCSNCGRQLVIAATDPQPPKTRRPTTRRRK